jgi:hypothetical protein
VKGKVVISGTNAPPEMFTVGFGMGGSTPFTTSDGSFELDDLPPGEHQLTINGPQFDRKQVPVKIESDKIADAGTITVVKGRTISGRVLDAGGQPVAGASVFAGRRLIGDGSRPSSGGWAPGAGSKTTTTDERGEFTLYGVGNRDLALTADHETLGRSATVSVPGSDDPVSIDLVLMAFGALEGSVTRAGEPLEAIVVNATPSKVPNNNFAVQTGADGKFRFDRLAPDTYQVSAMPSRGFMAGFQFHSRTVTVTSNQIATVSLTVDEGPGTLIVQLTPPEGRTVNFALVRIASFPVSAATARELEAKITAAPDNLRSYIQWTINGMPARQADLPAGKYTACAIPFPAEVMGMQQTMDYMMREGDNLKVFCAEQTVVEGEQTLSIPVEIPAFVPPPQGT